MQCWEWCFSGGPFDGDRSVVVVAMVAVTEMRDALGNQADECQTHRVAVAGIEQFVCEGKPAERRAPQPERREHTKSTGEVSSTPKICKEEQ